MTCHITRGNFYRPLRGNQPRWMLHSFSSTGVILRTIIVITIPTKVGLHVNEYTVWNVFSSWKLLGTGCLFAPSDMNHRFKILAKQPKLKCASFLFLHQKLINKNQRWNFHWKNNIRLDVFFLGWVQIVLTEPGFVVPFGWTVNMVMSRVTWSYYSLA